MSELIGKYLRITKSDSDYLVSISESHGDFARHVRKAISEYVKRLKKEV